MDPLGHNAQKLFPQGRVLKGLRKRKEKKKYSKLEEKKP